MMLIAVALVSGVDSKAMVRSSAATPGDHKLDKLTSSPKQRLSYTRSELLGGQSESPQPVQSNYLPSPTPSERYSNTNPTLLK
jgi:hypothetical protein